MIEDFLNSFRNSLDTGYIDKKIPSELLYQPKLLVNNDKPRKKILSSLLREFETCDSFLISVAFVTTGGVATIINMLHQLEEKEIPGKIIVSQYLNFTQPEALRRLLQFKNIELKIATDVNSHSKGYIFKKETHCNLIIGSSNLTQSALASNKEWNLQVSAIRESSIVNKVLNEFEKDFISATTVDEKFIQEYQIIYDRKKLFFKIQEAEIEPTYDKVFVPNTMQIEAQKCLNDLRLNGKSKALIISATGTGKTFLGAFDVQAFESKKMLFVVHRLNIAKKAMETFKEVFGDKKSMGIYSGKSRELDCDFLFSTVQTISKQAHLTNFESDHFDYIIIDESHRSGAKSYIDLINYFSPKFLLGMTATPERTDGNDIFQLFDHNIAYEIRLSQAMEENMLCPFHYYGVSDLSIDKEEKENVKLFNRLTSDERVQKIIAKANFYGTDNGITRGLIFVSKIEEAKVLSEKFNQIGYKTVALSGKNNNEERARAIDALESENYNEKLDYIFTVDIFNEGIDIPMVNQIIMLRPTESAIVFVQQLGRGLRKLDNKSYLTVIDFIGNHSNNFLIPMALYGDSSFDKDKLRKLLSDGSTELPGVSTINFDRISKEKIFESIDSANMRLLADLKRDYYLLKYKLGRIPMMMDFWDSESRNPFLFIEYSKSYYNFVRKVDTNFEEILNKEISSLLELFSKEVNNSRRVEESLVLKLLIEHGELAITDFQDLIEEKYNYKTSRYTIDSCIANINFKFIRKDKNVITLDNGKLKFHSDFLPKLKINTFKKFLLDSIIYSINAFEKSFNMDYYRKGLILYNKYSRKDVCRLLDWDTDISSTLYGYRSKNGVTPCFVTYNKSEDIEDTIKYNDHFITPSIFAWESRSNRRIDSNEIKQVIDSERILLFVKKEDSEGSDFYYLGDVSIVKNSIEQGVMPNSKKPVVHFKFQLEQPVEDNLYNYITERKQKKLMTVEVKKPDLISEEHTINHSNFTIPLFSLYAAAGSFSELQTSREFEMISVEEKYARKDYFAFKVIGESMNRRIPNGSICIFKHPVVGSRSGKILLIEMFDRQDRDLNSHFTVKTYTSSKSITEEGWRHESILLKPNSFDSSYEDMLLTQEDFENRNFNVVGEFVGIVNA
jgi:superfamily II DNA or RNA helicase/HKD family nuclease/phage repressor protein C with HTH and peptisase S24 domain